MTRPAQTNSALHHKANRHRTNSIQWSVLCGLPACSLGLLAHALLEHLWTFLLMLFTGLLAFVTWKADETQRSIQRAFVFSKAPNLFQEPPPTINPAAILIVPVENAGTTPATDLSITENEIIYKTGDYLPENFDFPDAHDSRKYPVTSGNVLGPKETTIAPLAGMTAKCLEPIWRGDLHLILWDKSDIPTYLGVSTKHISAGNPLCPS